MGHLVVEVADLPGLAARAEAIVYDQVVHSSGARVVVLRMASSDFVVVCVDHNRAQSGYNRFGPALRAAAYPKWCTGCAAGLKAFNRF